MATDIELARETPKMAPPLEGTGGGMVETGWKVEASWAMGAGVGGVGGMAMEKVDDFAELPVLVVEWERWRPKLRPFRAEERRELLLRRTLGFGEFVMFELDVVGRGTGTAGRGFSQKESRFWPYVRTGIRPPLICERWLMGAGRGEMAAESLWLRRCGLWLRASRSRNDVPAP